MHDILNYLPNYLAIFMIVRILRIEEVLYRGFLPVECKLFPSVDQVRKPPIICKISDFPDYKGFLVPTDESSHRIWIVQVKIATKLKNKILNFLMMFG